MTKNEKMMKKQLLLLAMMLLPMVAMADAVEIGGIYYNLITKGKIAEVTSNPNKYSGSVAIPEKVKHEETEYSVTSIGNNAFSWCSGLTSITIPNSVTSIGNSAFYWCSGLTSITIPNSVTSIGNSAFYGCKGLTSITIPGSVTNIGDFAFDSCSGLTSITIGNSVTSIGAYAFQGCSGLTSITIPNSVTSIEAWAFSGCSGLISITIPNSVTSIGQSAFYQCSGLTSVTIGSGVKSVLTNAFASCTELTDVYCFAENVPSTYSDAFADSYIEYATLHVPTTSIDTYKATTPWSSFGTIVSSDSSGTCGDNLTWTFVESTGKLTISGTGAMNDYSYNNFAPWNNNRYNIFVVVIEDGVTSIGNYAFSYCRELTSVTIPNSVTSIGNGAFESCSELASVTIPYSVTNIGGDAFSGCSNLNSVHISDLEAWCKISFNQQSNPLEYAHHLFLNGEEIKDLVIPNSVTSIKERAFSGCTGLTSVTIPNSVTSIKDAAFFGCTGLTSVTIPSSVKSMGYSVFVECTGLTSVTIPNSVTNIKGGTFSGCSGLTSIAIPNSVTSIEFNAFECCSSLTTITIGNGMKKIDSQAFAYCSKLTDVYCYAENVPSTNTYAFESSSIENVTLHVPDASISQYTQTAPWSGFKTIVALTSSDPNPELKCAKPTIKYIGGKLKFECETEGVEFISHFSTPAGTDNNTSEVSIPTTYNVSVYAKKEGYLNSDVATENIDVRGLKGDTNGDGEVNVADLVTTTNIIMGKDN